MLFRIKSPGRRPHDAGYGKISSLSSTHPLKHKKPRERTGEKNTRGAAMHLRIHPLAFTHHTAVDNFCFFRAAPQIDVDIPCTRRILSPLSGDDPLSCLCIDTMDWKFVQALLESPPTGASAICFSGIRCYPDGPGIIFGWLRRRLPPVGCGAADL